MLNEQDRAIVKKYVEKQNKLESERRQWETHWQEALDYIIPRKGNVTNVDLPGSKRGNELFDTTAIHANQILAAALHSMLTNPTSRFFDLVTNDSSLDDLEDVKMYLQECSSRMFQILNNSNFQTEIHELYIDLVAIGTACMFIGEHDDRVVHFATRPMKEIYVDENNLGIIDTVHRKFDWKLRQIVQEFGEKSLPEKLLKKYKDGNEDTHCIVHAVHPMSDEDKDSGRYGGKTFKSCYILDGEDPAILSEGGFNEMPYIIPRWTKTSGEKYGRGPGMDMLPDIKMVNRMMETVLKGAQKTVDPPLMVTDDGVIGNVRLTPGGLTRVRPFNEAPIRPLITDARIDFGQQVVELVRQRIKAGFYVDQLQLVQSDRMTTVEVNQRVEETLRLMGPVLGRQHFESLAPMIDRLFGICSRRNLLPAPPKVLQGRRVDVQYSSMIAKAQRASEGQMLTRAIGMAAPIIQAIPSTLDNLNGDAALKYIFDMNGIPHKLLNTDEVVKKQRDSRAQMQAQAMQQQQQQAEMDSMSKVAPLVAASQQGQARK